MTLTWDQVLSWRVRRQFLDRTGRPSAGEVVKRLCGLQSQVVSNPELSVAVRSTTVAPRPVRDAVAERSVVRTWAMRGTLHTLDVEDAPAFLALLASARTWEKGSWQRTFLDSAQMARLSEVVREELDGALLSRDDLVAVIDRRLGDPAVAAAVRSGWGPVLKPLAWQGLLCNGSGDGNDVRFTSPASYLPGWKGLPDVDEAARVAIPRYLSAFGPADPETFNGWLIRGALRKADVRGWFRDLGDALQEVDVEGRRLWIRAEDADALAAAEPVDSTRLLPAFDQYLMSVGTTDDVVVPTGRRSDISRASGWIAPIVVSAGRIVGVWDYDDTSVAVTLFPECPRPSDDVLREEIAHVRPLLSARKSDPVVTIS